MVGLSDVVNVDSGSELDGLDSVVSLLVVDTNNVGFVNVSSG